VKTSRLLLSALLALALSPARAADRQSADVPVVPAVVVPAVNAAPSLTPTLGAPLTVPTLSSPLGAPSAQVQAGAGGPRAQAMAPDQARAAAALPLAASKAAASASNTSSAVPPSLPQSPIRGPDSAAQAAAPLAAGASATAADASDHPLIQRAKAEAAKLGTTAVESGSAASGVAEQALSRLNTRDGYALVPPGALVTPEIAGNIGAAIDKTWSRNTDSLFNTWELHDEYKGWMRDVGGTDGRGGARELVEALTKQLQAAMPGEAITLRDAQLRLRYKKQDSDVLHVDGGYVTATITLKGPGTLLYPQSANGAISELESPVGAVAVVTNIDRERATGIPGTVHSSPTSDRYRPGRDDERWVLIVRYKRAGQPAATDSERYALKTAHDRSRGRVQRMRDAKNVPAKSPPAKKPARNWFGFGTRNEE
jgi:hypothetical protein